MAQIITVDIAKRLDNGEDAPPLALRANGCWLLGVFDGLGGAGGHALVDQNGESRSAAYRASRLARETVEEFFARRDSPDGLPTTEAGAVALQQFLADRFQQGLSRYTAPASRLKGKLIRRLPTTMAVIHVQDDADVGASARVFWAGDSRAFVFTPRDGLQQLTHDDLRQPGDAWDNLFNDSPMANMISDDQFVVHGHEVSLNGPAVLLAASDGCFGYVSSPPQFELLLLDALVTARSVEDWQRQIEESIAGITGDDATLAAAAIGWPTFDAIRRAFWPRYRRLLDQAHTCASDASPDASRAWWDRYKPRYEALLPGREENAS